MATVDSRELVDKIIAANGALYDDEAPVVRIVEYENAFDHRTARFKNGKQRTFVQDVDHGTRREWRSPKHRIY